MMVLKRTLAILESVIIMIVMLYVYTQGNIKANAKSNLFRQNPVIVDVILYDFKDKYISLVRENFENIQKQNEGKVIFKFFDGKGNQAIQNEVMSSLTTDNFDILLVNLVDTTATKDVIEKFRNKNIPIIFFNREPVSIDSIKSYNKSYYVGTNAREAGILQGKIITDLWNNNRNAIDKNNDGVLQYIMLQGQLDSIEARERSQFSISAINEAGIKTVQLASSVSNWDRELARTNINALFLQYSSNVEAIISNNDEMAIGAIEALQQYGYNLGDKNKESVVVGVDAIPEAQELIKKGFMAGSVLQDPSEMAKAVYTIGLNIFQGKDPLFDTNYKFDQSGVAVRLPYREYLG